ncbi:MAG: hypothetical protein P8J68_10570 [Arenicellaceae bacterium]|nr:hypothetical protein [Arenicellaceae bacterium]
MALRCRLGEEESIPLLWAISRHSINGVYALQALSIVFGVISGLV